MTSKRLPGKVLHPMNGKPMLEYVLDALARAETVARSIVLTSQDHSDDPIAAWCQRHGRPCFRGDLEDVTARFLAAAHEFGIERFVRISGDSPLLDSRIVDRAVGLFEAAPCDLVTNVLVRTFPRGQSVEVISRNALERAYASMSDSQDREHVTRYFYRNPEEFDIRDFRHTTNYSHLQMAVDTQEDFDKVAACITRLDVPHWALDLDALIRSFAGTQADR